MIKTYQVSDLVKLKGGCNGEEEPIPSGANDEAQSEIELIYNKYGVNHSAVGVVAEHQYIILQAGKPLTCVSLSFLHEVTTWYFMLCILPQKQKALGLGVCTGFHFVHNEHFSNVDGCFCPYQL